MATKPIIKIDIDDSAFQRFSSLFKAYSDKLEDQPAEWRELNEAMTQAGGAFNTAMMAAQDNLAIAAASTAAIVETIHNAAKAQDGFTRSTTTGTKAMKALGDQVKSVIGGVLELGKTVFKFGTVGGGLAGLGAGIGLDDLSGSALSSQRSASGLGLSVGQMRAFQTNMSEYVGNNVLTGAANAQIDPSQYGYLAALGISGAKAASESASDLATQEINAVRMAWKSNPSLLTAQSKAALALGFTVADIRNVGTANGANLAGDESAAANTAGLGFSASTAHAWAQLSIALQKAGYTVQTALIDGLQPLTPLLTKLSGAASDAIAALLKSPELKDDLTEFTNWLSSPKFVADLKAFSDAVGDIAAKVKAALIFFGFLPSTSSPPTPGAPQSGQIPYDPKDPKDNWPPAMRAAFGLPPIDPTTLPGYQPPAPGSPGSPAAASYSSVMKDFMDAGYSQKFAASFASNAYSESKFDPSAKNVDPKTGAIHAGMYQWSATRRAQILAGTGIDVWKDFDRADQDRAAIWELQHTYKAQAAQIAAVTDGNGLYNGMDRANAGGIAVDNLYEGSGDNFIQQAIRGARAHVFDKGYSVDPSVPASPSAIHPDVMAVLKRIAHQGNQPTKVSLNVNNNTASRVSVSANNAAYG